MLAWHSAGVCVEGRISSFTPYFVDAGTSRRRTRLGFILMAVAVCIGLGNLWSASWFYRQGSAARGQLASAQAAASARHEAFPVYSGIAEIERLSRQWSRWGNMVSGGGRVLTWSVMFLGLSFLARANRTMPRGLMRVGLGAFVVTVALLSLSTACRMIGDVNSDRVRDAAGMRQAAVGPGYATDADYLRLMAEAHAVQAAWIARSRMVVTYGLWPLLGVMGVLIIVVQAQRYTDRVASPESK
jgi:hypothetical protein